MKLGQESVATTDLLHGLKTFQRRTVERAFRRLYLDDDCGTRFLVADEVGLGKTMVARGLIAKVVEHLQREGKVKRIDIVYVCSNAAIAKQNLNRLSMDQQANFIQANRLTMLATSLGQLREDRPNFVSFTPGTSFELKSSGGRAEERLVLLKMLKRKKLNLAPGGLRRLLRCEVGPQRWREMIRKRDQQKIDWPLHRQFLRELRADKALYRELRKLALQFDAQRGKPARDLNSQRYSMIGRLRTVLARTCVRALEPDLVILDEFQRFKTLLDANSEDEAAKLANLLMNQRDEIAGHDTRVVLLSATPYRMLTLDHESEENHYADFLQTLRFLFRDESAKVARVETGLSDFRRALLDGSVDAAREASTQVADLLRQVMTRTERVSVTRDRDAMLMEPPLSACLGVDDLMEAVAVDRISRAIGAPEPVEYWKSSPYLVSTLKGYELKKRLLRGHRMEDVHVREALDAASRYGLRREQLASYAAIDPRNGRLRLLIADTIGRGQSGLLWLAPSLPYWKPAGAWSNCTAPTKSLVFSSWNVAPDSIAALCSYEAERTALTSENVSYFDLHDQRKPLLIFKMSGEQVTGMMHLALLYPCATLAAAIDPLRLSLEAASDHVPCEAGAVLAQAERRIEELLSSTGRWPTSGTDRVDQRWYWAAPALLDAIHHPEVRAWCVDKNGWRAAGASEDATDEDRASGFQSALQRFLELERDAPLGRAPDDLVAVLAEQALAAPGTVALRSLLRLFDKLASAGFPEKMAVETEVLQAAAMMAEGMRTLFNHPESIGLLVGDSAGETPYSRRTLQAGIDGNLQATSDEYLHVLRESQGLLDRSPKEAALQIARTFQEAASMRSSRVVLDEVDVGAKTSAEMFKPMNVRSRFALRFGQMKDDKDQTVARVGTVREAFNSPFRPFILATTSIGQEGLDFHTYCHVLYHWNLPSNPVDLEQREGRIQRYKGHAVRRNVATRFGLQGLRDAQYNGGDPWKTLFALAASDGPAKGDDSELCPYWIYETEGGARIERRVPMLPFSREIGQLTRLKRGLTIYRLAFGQPRQEDLLQLLSASTDDLSKIADLQIDLRP